MFLPILFFFLLFPSPPPGVCKYERAWYEDPVLFGKQNSFFLGKKHFWSVYGGQVIWRSSFMDTVVCFEIDNLAVADTLCDISFIYSFI